MQSRFPSEGSVPEFLAALASPDDVHGALAAAAMAGAIGVSLLQRIAVLPQAMRDAGAAHVSAAAAFVRIQEELLETVETQTAVKLFAARNLPQTDEAERETRERAIQLALRAAADVPLEVMRLCGEALQRARTVAGDTGRGASADVELAVALLESAINAARLELESKLPILTDASHVTSLGERVARIGEDAAAAAAAVRSFVRVPPA
jgi:formiminotetrahydrofolate cyclodeaminase